MKETVIYKTHSLMPVRNQNSQSHLNAEKVKDYATNAKSMVIKRFNVKRNRPAPITLRQTIITARAEH